ncbi:hypothetical protein HBI56_074240 [Parastagonospora nodorum]|uniref:Uncharacterized protein n=1 Tax=Phaeosphaeria nodorum (strain SN15 / ATCC MYA-4574 / FGSC 10173) TaxID=321614 RepID=A0A7U2EXD0_PHANO|nr:hypothetical protein HBH56_170740 [Parastagonospora nodorum]QRC94477.1 hypothetical protein JI435_077110 [Parastagonospora nodorum SN15]KAH3928684.1 hypothetical protein HBH54_139300 [Parastagonospora nodorum]KAH3945341.1 hypothetical protein HBH53_144650 [Parastagonospora nodorum]KAH3984104.1 hypothetical protein HBH52_059570 [Parastagonospora nodorum]
MTPGRQWSYVCRKFLGTRLVGTKNEALSQTCHLSAIPDCLHSEDCRCLCLRRSDSKLVMLAAASWTGV